MASLHLLQPVGTSRTTSRDLLPSSEYTRVRLIVLNVSQGSWAFGHVPSAVDASCHDSLDQRTQILVVCDSFSLDKTATVTAKYHCLQTARHKPCMVRWYVCCPRTHPAGQLLAKAAILLK